MHPEILQTWPWEDYQNPQLGIMGKEICFHKIGVIMVKKNKLQDFYDIFDLHV